MYISTESLDNMSYTPTRKITKESTPHREAKYAPRSKNLNMDHLQLNNEIFQNEENANSDKASVRRSRSSSKGS